MLRCHFVNSKRRHRIMNDDNEREIYYIAFFNTLYPNG